MTYNKNHAGKLDALLLFSIEFLQDDVIDFNFNNNFLVMNMCFLVE